MQCAEHSINGRGLCGGGINLKAAKRAVGICASPIRREIESGDLVPPLGAGCPSLTCVVHACVRSDDNGFSRVAGNHGGVNPGHLVQGDELRAAVQR